MSTVNCRSCDAEWPITAGIPQFMESHYYWGFTPEEDSERFIQVTESEGWRKGLEVCYEQQNKDPQYTAEYATNPERVNFQVLLDLAPGQSVLDIGSGLGAITIPLAEQSLEVTALDPTYANLRFVKARAEQEGLSNVSAVNADVVALDQLPFPAESFDIVILNGVIEWLGLSREQPSPDIIQRDVLGKIYRVLKPGGRLYLATENRFGVNYFLGQKDEHSGLRFATVLPRPVANLYSRLARKRSYRAYTPSWHWLTGTLRDLGFTEISPFYLHPNYRVLKHLVPLEDTAVLDHFFSTFEASSPLEHIRILGALLLVRLRVFRFFTPNFAVIALKK